MLGCNSSHEDQNTGSIPENQLLSPLWNAIGSHRLIVVHSMICQQIKNVDWIKKPYYRALRKCP